MNETPKASRRGVWGGSVPLPIRQRGLGERRELSSQVRGRVPAQNEFGAFCRLQESTGVKDSRNVVV